MTASQLAQGRERRRGFSLIELLIVIIILGLTFTLGLAGLNSVLKRQRLGSAAAELSTLAGRALTEMQNRNASTYLVFGKYVADVGTDVVVSIDGNGDGDGVDVDKNNDGLFNDANNDDRVLWRSRVPADVALSNTALATQTFNTQWARPSSGSASAVLMCDFLGRAMIPGATPAMITGPATVQLSHREMITGSLTPLVTYTVSIQPLFKSTVTRVP